MSSSTRRPVFRLLPRLLALAAATAVLAEVAARLLFCGHALDRVPGMWRLKHPERLGDPRSHDAYWIAARRIADAESIDDVPEYDPILGWTGVAIAPGTYEHRERASLAGRRPVLLYGDSFSNCTTPPEDCFQGWLARSDLAWGHAMLNHGVGGYGLDQIYLLLERTLDRYLELEPLVLVGFLVDDDFDRTALSFRVWPKPRLALRGGALQPEEPAVPRLAEYLRSTGGLGSYAWRFLVHGTGVFPGALGARLRGDAGIESSKRELGLALLEAIERLLAERGVPHAFVLFHGEQAVRDSSWLGWREELAAATLERLGTRRVSVRAAILRECAAAGGSPAQFFEQLPSGPGHLNARGNEVAFAAMREALIELGARPVGPGVSAAAIELLDPRGPTAAARCEIGSDGPFPDPAECTRIVVRAGAGDRVVLGWTTGGRVRRFRAGARVAGGNLDRVEVTIAADGERLWHGPVRGGEARIRLAVGLEGRQELRVAVTGSERAVEPALLVLAEPFFD